MATSRSVALANRTGAAAAALPATEQGLARIAEVWRTSMRGGAFLDALRTFLASLRSERTREMYTACIVDFFDWHELRHARLVAPDEVTRERAFEYAKWLREVASVDELKEYRLRKSGRKLAYAIYQAVRRKPGIHIADVRGELEKDPTWTVRVEGGRALQLEQGDPYGLDRELACLVGENVLTREPSMSDIRSGRVKVGGDRDPRQAGIGYRVDPDIFAYYPASHEMRARQASSITARLRSLMAFWAFLIDSGENVAGSREPLIRYNIWAAPAKQTGREARVQQGVHRAKRTPNLELFNRILGTTYEAVEHGVMASQRFDDVRDRAILLFTIYVGPRVSELTTLNRGDVAWGTAPTVELFGKGKKKRLVMIPPQAYQALLELTGKIEERVAAAERARKTDVASGLLDAKAPLFPPVKRWGCQAERAHGPRLTRTAIERMLHHRAELAGLAVGSDDYLKVHPHGIRHLAAKLSVKAGTPLNIVQAVLGHESLATTGQYVESHETAEQILYHGARPQAPAPTVIGPTVIAQPPPAAPAPRPAAARAPAAPARPEPPRPARIIPTVGVPVPDVPPAPTPHAERLVEVGGQAPLRLPAEDMPVVDAVERLQVVYTTEWGEKGDRQRLKRPQGALKGEDDEPIVAAEILVQSYVGRDTGLPWWAGPTGSLEPALPVMGPLQLDGAETPFGSVLVGLESLWKRWMETTEGRGPTAASALVAWARDALEVANQVGVEVSRRRGDWVPHDASLESTYLPTRDAERKRFRHHRDDRIIEWFEGSAWQHRISRGRTGVAGERQSRVLDKRPDLPAWYREADPLATLNDSDRRELFDWLWALTGKPPRDTSPKFDHGVSRRAVAEVIGLLCEYDDRLDELKEASRSGDRSGVAQLKQDLQQLEDAIRLTVAKATSQRLRDFDVRRAVESRIAETRRMVEREGGSAPGPVLDERVAVKERGRESRRDFYLRLVGEVFGKAAGDDEILRIFALCSRGAPLAQGSYPDLFRIDPKAKTIVHTPEFATEFARATGTHSECVARRLARELWELRAQSARIVRKGGLERPDELVEALDAMAAYRVPCPAAQEGELKSRLGPQAAVPPIYEEWKRWQDETRGETDSQRRARERAETIAEEMAEAQAAHREAAHREFVGGLKPNPRAREHRYKSNAAKLVPTPVRLLFCLYCR
jgi:integrase